MIVIDKDVMVPMTDGVRLASDVSSKTSPRLSFVAVPDRIWHRQTSS